MCVKLSAEKLPHLTDSIELVGVNTLANRIRDLPFNWKKLKFTDGYYYIPTFDDWVKIVNYLKKKVPKYRTNKFDCENFAGWFRIMVGDKFGINTMADVEGNIYHSNGVLKGRHGWNIFTDGKFWFQLESQTGVIMDIDDQSYIPDEIVVG